MDLNRLGELAARLSTDLGPEIISIDSHTGGEINRVVVSGAGPLPGATMADKRQALMDGQDRIRRLTCREPRGHRHLEGALVTEPVTPGAAFGLIYMDARRYPYLCGTATIGAVATFLDLELLKPEGERTQVVVDTPSGPMTTTLYARDGRVESIGLEFVPGFVHGRDLDLEVPGLGSLKVDTVCVGGFFAMVSADQIGPTLTPDNGRELTEMGMAVIRAANEQLSVSHPLRPEVDTVDVTQFYDPQSHFTGQGLGAVVYGESHLDRSPCGTGTAAKLALLHRRGVWDRGRSLTNAGVLGTTFQAAIRRTTKVGDIPAVVVEVRSMAQVTGVHRYLVREDDPFPEGFLI